MYIYMHIDCSMALNFILYLKPFVDIYGVLMSIKDEMFLQLTKAYFLEYDFLIFNTLY